MLLAIVTAVVGLVQLTLHFVAGINIEMYLYGTADPAGLGSTAPAAAFCLLLAAICILIDLAFGRRAEHIYQAVAGTGLLVAGLDLIAYSFDVQALYAVELLRAIALHTAICFLLLFLALLCRRPTWSWMATVTSPLNGSFTFRRVLLPAVLAPWLFCWLSIQASNHALLTPNFRLVLVATACILVLVVVLLLNGMWQNQISALRTQALLDLQTAVGQRDLLLREVYHRVKNNLQLVEALLLLQSRKIESGQAREAIHTTRQRIHTLGMVHQKILEGADYTSVDLKAFLRDVVESLAAGFGAAERNITVTFRGHSTRCTLEEAIPLGLLTNELMSNTFKHAFTGRETGHVTVELAPAGGELRLTVADDGVGRRERPQNGRISLGSDIIMALVAQLDGDLRETADNGTRIDVTIAQPAGAG
jgi:two-component sensor histidine kinase